MINLKEGDPSTNNSLDITTDDVIDNPQMGHHHEEAISKPPPPRKNSQDFFKYTDTPSWYEITGEPTFNIGIVINARTTTDRYTKAISKPGSSCHVKSLVILTRPNNDEEEKSEFSSLDRKWLKHHHLVEDAKDISLSWGDEAFRELIKRPDIDAVYIIVPPGLESKYVLSALEAGKHVLLRDPRSTSLVEFTEQLDYATRFGKFVQFSTMFVHQYRVQRFMDRVLREESFGRIHSIKAHLFLNYNDINKVGCKLPLGEDEGSIRVLGRFCVLVSTLFFNRVGSFAKSAQVHEMKKSPEGVILSADCSVKYTEGRELRFQVGYTNTATRQLIEVKADSRYAAMTDFVIEHPCGLASYRVYEKERLGNGKLQVVSGEAFDLAGGPTQNVMMFRTFVQMSHSLDKKGGWDHSVDTAACRELANVAIQTKQILNALLKSSESSLEEVFLEDVDYQ